MSPLLNAVATGEYRTREARAARVCLAEPPFRAAAAVQLQIMGAPIHLCACLCEAANTFGPVSSRDSKTSSNSSR